jgi:hypothetical protein
MDPEAGAVARQCGRWNPTVLGDINHEMRVEKVSDEF